jgi:hypothetical protein
LGYFDVDERFGAPFTRHGNNIEQLHGLDNFTAGEGRERWLTVPSNYGRVWRNA